MDLDKLTDEVQRLTTEYRAVEPEVTEEALQERIWHYLRAKGQRTRQMGGARLCSKHASLVSAASSLSAAKTSLAEAGPPPPDRSLKMRKSKPASMPMARKRVSAARSSACPPPAPKMAAPVLKMSPLGDDSEEEDDD